MYHATTKEPPLVLVADDDPVFAGQLSGRLMTMGCRVEVAQDGNIAAQKARALHPALMLTEVFMPGRDGVSAVLELKTDPATKSLPIFFLTKLGDIRPGGLDVDQLAAKQVGAEGYIRKTDSLERIIARVRGVLREL
jgi:CheY-like chemotaxis protein